LYWTQVLDLMFREPDNSSGTSLLPPTDLNNTSIGVH
jgi:hypothetical protein